MTLSKPVDDAQAWMSGDYTDTEISFRQAIIREGLSKLTEMTVIFQSEAAVPDLDLAQFVGKDIKVHFDTDKGEERQFGGICISVEFLGFRSGFYQYVAEVRPRLWLLTRGRDNRVFQNKTTQQIVEEVLSDAGISRYEFKLKDQYEERQYCVQFNETNYDFICRLIEQEGIYFFFNTTAGYKDPDMLTFCDNKTSHLSDGELEFGERTKDDFTRRDINEWAPSRAVISGKITLDDYEFFSPTAQKSKSSTTIATGDLSTQEQYIFPGRFRGEGDTPGDGPITGETTLAQKRADVRMEAEEIAHRTWRGSSSAQTLGVGYLFSMIENPDAAANTEYLVTSAVHFLKASMDIKHDVKEFDLKPKNFDIDEELEDAVYFSTIEALEADVQYRAPLKAPWPIIPGLQTATVVGPAGEEIWTDDYGRIKVKFHWDRLQPSDDTASCWIRVVTPWAGKKWGFSAVPRIGQEVVIQFEDGDPSRPICTGMLYNEDNPKVYSKKETSTEIGIRTDSTKNVSDVEAFNEIMFDDEKDKELMRVQAQKDHRFLTKNISRIGVGLATADELKDYSFDKAGEDGSLLEVVKNHHEEEIQEGDHLYKVTTGSQEKTIHTDFTETIETGNHATTVSQGNMTVDVSAGKIEMEAAQKIVLKVGASKITIDNTGVKIEGGMLKFEGTGMAEMKAPKSTVKGDAMLTLRGGVTMIN